jgi:hypothetical protein
METLKKNPFNKIFATFGKGTRKGGLNIISGSPGIGKSTMLAHLGIYKVLEGNPIVHVSRAQPEKVSTYYDAVLLETTRELEFGKRQSIKDLISQGRKILSFVDQVFHIRDLYRALENLRSISYDPCCLLMDGFTPTLLDSGAFWSLLKEGPYETWLTLNDFDPLWRSHTETGFLIELSQRGETVVAVVRSLREGKEEGTLELELESNSLLLIE